MWIAYCIAVFLLSTASCIRAATVSKTIPFGDAALWASGVKEVQTCAQGECEEELRMGVIQALKYAMNNARMAMKHSADTKMVEKYLKAIDGLTMDAAKLEDMDQEGKKWQEKFKSFTKTSVALFNEDGLKKMLKEINVTMEIVNDDIGLSWRSQSLDIPTYSKDDVKKALSELKFKMNNDIEIPRIGFGTWQMEEQECQDAVLAALKAGYRHIDTAQSYENEAEVGKAIQEAIKQGIIMKREDIFLVTKLSDPQGYSTKKAAKSIKQQLELLQTSFVDVYMLHGPEETKKNRAAWKGMMKMQKEEKINSLGISNFESEDEVKALARNIGKKPNYIQNKFSIYSPGGQGVDEVSMLQIAKRRGMAFVGYSVVNPWPFVLPPMKDPHVMAIAERYNRSPALILYRWALQLNVVIIPKSSKAERIAENARVVEFAIEEADMRLLNGLSILYHSTTQQRPSFAQDIYGLFSGEDDEGKEEMPRDEL